MPCVIVPSAECCALKRDDKRKLQAINMRMLRIVRGKTLGDGISNATIRFMTGMEKIEKFLKEQSLRWIGHIDRMDDERATMKQKNFVIDGSKRDKPNKGWKM